MKNVESMKSLQLNLILEKISNNVKLTDDEKKFLEIYDTITENTMKSYHCLSNSGVYHIISEFLEKQISIICNLEDRNGKIMSPIMSIWKENNRYYIKSKSGDIIELIDRHLFNIDFTKTNTYSLYSYDEFHEEMLIEK